jgi:hypothetical protein
MNFSDIIKAVREQQESGNTVSLHNQTEILMANSGTLERHEMKALKTSICVFPKEIQLPFNPVDPGDTHFNSEKKFIVKDAPTAFVKALKAEMKDNKELCDFYARLIKKTSDEYDVSDVDTITEDDFAIFNQYTVPAQFSTNTQKIKTAAAGRFGREVASPLSYDEDGVLVNASEHLLGRLFGLEKEIRSEKLAEFDLNNDKSTLTSDQKNLRDAIAKSSQVSAPKKSGVIVFLEFTGSEKNDGFKFDRIEADKLDSYLRYFNCNADELKKINRKLHKKKDDTNLDYIILQVGYGDGTAANTTLELALYQSRQYEKVDSDVLEELVKYFADKDDFVEKIEAIISNGLQSDFDKKVKRSVFKFRPISDADLAELYKHRVPEIKPYITERIYLEYGDTIEIISPAIKKELDTLSSKHQLRISSKEIIETSDQADDFTGSIEDLDKLDVAGSPDDVIDTEVGVNLGDLIS